MTSLDSPAIKKNMSVSVIMFTVVFALIPALIAQIGFFGLQILGNLIIGISFALILEAVCLKLRHYPIKPFLKDGSAFLTAWLLIISIPSSTPVWVMLVGLFFSIVISKHAYGGIGSNPFNPAMIGYAVLLISFPKIMTNWPSAEYFDFNNFLNFSQLFSMFTSLDVVDGIVSATPLDEIKTALFLGEPIKNSFSLFDQFNAYQIMSIFYLIGGLYLMIKKIITWHLPVSLILSIFLFSFILHQINPDVFMPSLFHLMNGATFLAAFFIITDPVSSPTTLNGKIIFGVMVGLITVIIRNFGGYPDGIAFAVIFMNIFVPLIEKFTQPKVFGYE